MGYGPALLVLSAHKLHQASPTLLTSGRKTNAARRKRLYCNQPLQLPSSLSGANARRLPRGSGFPLPFGLHAVPGWLSPGRWARPTPSLRSIGRPVATRALPPPPPYPPPGDGTAPCGAARTRPQSRRLAGRMRRGCACVLFRAVSGRC